MKHNIKQKKLNRTSTHRKSLLINLANSLIKHEQIKTTVPKAKQLKPFIEKIITKGKQKSIASIRSISSIIQDEINTKKVLDILSERYKDRNGGYCRIIKIGNRYGDNAPVAIIELVDRDTEAKGKDSGPIIERKTSEEVEDQQQV